MLFSAPLAWKEPLGLPEGWPVTTIPPQLQIFLRFCFVDAILPARKTGTDAVDQKRENSAEPAKRFLLLTWGMPIVTGLPLPSRPRGAKVTCLENLRYCSPLPPGIRHQGYSGVTWRQYVQAGMKGAEGLGEPG